MKRLFTILDDKMLENLKVGDEILLNGIIYTARDKAHQRLVEAIKKGKRLPIPLEGRVIYYCGPTPPAPGRIIGSCGPTTSSRMDEFSPPLLKVGLRGMIGKGTRSKEVIQAIKKYRAVYFLAIGGIGALLSTKVKAAFPVAYEQLGPEAIYKLLVEDFPVTVGIDMKGEDIYGPHRRKGKG